MTIPPVPPQGSEQPSAPPPPPRYEEPVGTYLAPAVLVTILCCLPAGLVAVYFSSRVSTMLAVGNRIGAIQAADKARLWCWIGGLLGLIWPLIILSMIFAGGIGLLQCLEGLDVVFD